MTLEELKIRQLTNQYLLAPADKLTVMRDLCGVQAAVYDERFALTENPYKRL